MRREHLGYLACPRCRGGLTLDGQVVDEAGDVERGVLSCRPCAASYPVIGHVPRFVVAAERDDGFGFQWNAHARTQCDSFNGTRISERRFFEATAWPRSLIGEAVLEVGSGAGRFTEHAAGTGAMVVSVDRSTAVEANFLLNGRKPNVLIVQGDVYALPLPAASFDRVFCFGVLQHLPDVRGGFAALASFLKPGGWLAVDVYRRRHGLARLTMTHRWLRPITRRMRPRSLYRITRAYVRAMWPLARTLNRIPMIGKKLNWMLLVADYRGVLDLSEDLLREWAVLDTFDMLHPHYEFPQTVPTVQDWFVRAGFGGVEVRCGHNGIEGRGRRSEPALNGP